MKRSAEVINSKRPIGITITAFFLGAWGAIVLLAALPMLFLFLLGDHHIHLAFTIDLLALANVILAWGLWKLKSWAYWSVIVVHILSILNSYLLSNVIPNSSSEQLLWNAIFSVAIIAYFLIDHRVRIAFAR